MRLVMGFDDNYVGPFLTTIFSAWVTKSHNFDLLIAYEPSKLSRSNRKLVQKILKLLKIKFEFQSVQLRGLPTAAHINESAYLRIFLTDKLNEKFVWLDCDIQCKEGWDELLCHESKSADTIVHAVRDPIVSLNYESSHNKAIACAKESYFNAGVIIIDGKVWKNLRVDLKWREAVLQYEQFGFEFHDQCVLNYISVNNFEPLESRFNVIQILKMFPMPPKTSIAHFAGIIKPWYYFSRDHLVNQSGLPQDSLREYLEMQKSVLDYFKFKESIWRDVNRTYLDSAGKISEKDLSHSEAQMRIWIDSRLSND